MKFREVKNIPGRKGGRVSKHELQDFITQFYESGMMAAEVTFGDKEYANAKSCYNALHKANSTLGIKTVKVRKRKDGIYLERVSV